MIAYGADFAPEIYPGQPTNLSRPDPMVNKQSYFDSSNNVSRYTVLTWVVY